MRSVVSEWPLVVFTSVAPLCAGVWIIAALLALFDVFPGANTVTTGLTGVLLCLLLAASLACSTLHLGKPLKALRAFMRLGNSAVSNEVFMGTLFAVASCLYVVLAQSLVAEGDLWKIPLAFVAGCAGLFVLFQCLAYRMRTVPTWSSSSFSLSSSHSSPFWAARWSRVCCSARELRPTGRCARGSWSWRRCAACPACSPCTPRGRLWRKPPATVGEPID